MPIHRPYEYDAIILGAGAAGLSAGLALGRARRSVLILDDDQPRNAASSVSYGFLTRDGTRPAELLHLGREQLVPYGVEVRPAHAVSVQPHLEGFQVKLASGSAIRARRLLFATGVRDLLPEIPGVQERWGKSIHQCPYCHGWEVRDKPVAVYQQGEYTFFRAGTIHQWAPDLLLLTDGPAQVTAEQRTQLQRLGIDIDERPLMRLEGLGATLERIVFDDGASVRRTSLFIGPRQEQRSMMPALIGCAKSEDGVYIRVDAQGQTSVPGIYAAGDMTGPLQQVVTAAASGLVAAAGLNHGLISPDGRDREPASPSGQSH